MTDRVGGPVGRRFGARLGRATRLVGAALAAAGAFVAMSAVTNSPVAAAGASWSGPTPIDTFNLMNSVSCSSASFCVAVDYQGGAVTYNGASWSSATDIDGSNDLTSVSCPSATFCGAVDYEGKALTYDGTHWSSPATADPGNELNSVSCPTATFCAAVDNDGNTLTSNGLVSETVTAADPGNDLSSVSCTSATFCAAVDGNGNALTYNGTHWSSPSAIDPGNDLSSVSCPSSTFCMAIDGSGNALTYNGTHWSSPTAADTADGLLSLSCTSATFCVAGAVDGNATIYDGTSWSTPDPVNDNVMVSLSCASASFCVAVDDAGFAVTYTGANPATVTDVEFSGSTAAPVITVSGSGFGTETDLGAAGAPGCGPYTGSDYADNLWIQDSTDNWVAGRGTACVGLVISSYTDTQVVFSFGSDYSFYMLRSGADFTLNLLGSLFSGTVSYSNGTQQASCGSGTTTCSAAATAPSQMVAVTGTKLSNATASILVSVATEVPGCPNFGYPAPVTTVEDTGLQSVTVTDTVGNLPSNKGVLICYQPVEPSPPLPRFLTKCHGKSSTAACFKSVTEEAGSVVVKLVLPAGDPRFHIGGVAPAVTSVSPTAPKAGKKLTIKGANLSEVTAVTVGGVNATILKRAPTSVKVDAPAGAHGVVVVTSVAGRAQSTAVVAVAGVTTHGGLARRHR